MLIYAIYTISYAISYTISYTISYVNKNLIYN